jgi:prevent-host-death family protein
VKTASAEEVRAHIDAYLKASVQGPVVVTRNAKPVAVLLSLKDPDEIGRIAMSHSKKLEEYCKLADGKLLRGMVSRRRNSGGKSSR